MNRQTGAALITGLIFMVVLTLVAMAGMRTTLMEQRMATNARNRDMAFQAAEAALREGIALLRGGTILKINFPAVGAGCTTSAPKGLCRPAGIGAPPIWDTVFPFGQASVSSQAATNPALASPLVANSPQYIIELLPDVQAPGGSLGQKVTPYRITARGWGRTSEAQATVQATYLVD